MGNENELPFSLLFLDPPRRLFRLLFSFFDAWTGCAAREGRKGRGECGGERYSFDVLSGDFLLRSKRGD
jgi:hypothetical protein